VETFTTSAADIHSTLDSPTWTSAISSSATLPPNGPPRRGPRRAGDGGRDAQRDGDGVLAAGGRAGAGGGEAI